MKKLFTLLTVLALVIGVLSVSPVTFAAGESYGPVTTPSDGKEYVLIWNKNQNDNLGDKYAIAAEGGEVSAVKVTDAELALGELDSGAVWLLEEISGGVWTIKNSEIGAYLCYDSSASSDAEKLTVTSEEQDDGTTSWKLKDGSISNQFEPLNNNGVVLRYSVSEDAFMLKGTSNNSWVWFYEKGSEICVDHVYSSCTATVCEKCGLKTRDSKGLQHTYSSDDDTECDVCGYVRYLFDEADEGENTAVRTFTATFADNGADSLPNDEYKNMFNLTSMVASVASLEDVTHVDITVDASNIESFENKNNASPTCQLFWNGWWNKHVESKEFGTNNVVTFSADVDPDIVESIWLLPYAFVPDTELSFRITVEVKYNGNEDADYGEPLTTIVSFSDYQLHGDDRASNNSEAITAQLNDIFNTMGKVHPDYVIFGGDYGCGFVTESSNYARTQLLGLLADRWSNISPEQGTYIQVEGNHDNSGVDGFIPTGGYEYDDFIVYILNEDDMPWSMYSSSDKEVCEATAAKMTEYFNALISAGETRPVIIASHTCLHYDVARNDGNNQYAYFVFDAINKAAEELDIIFMFGHNHSTGDPEIGGAIAYKAVGDTLYVSDENCYDADGKGYNDKLDIGRPEELNFTYMTYGYVGYVGNRLGGNELFSSLNPSTTLTSSTMDIYADKITIKVYSAGGRMSSYSRVIDRKVMDSKNVVSAPNDDDVPDKPSHNNEESGNLTGVYIAAAVIVVIAVVAIIVVVKKKKAK